MAILNMVGGGGGGLKSTDAILRVIAQAGSTVTISKGGVSKSDTGHENADDNTLYDYYFVIHQSQFDSINPWTVTATLGSDTVSDTIIIDSADEYDVVLVYGIYLYNNGDLCTDVTGGWGNSGWSVTGESIIGATYNTTSINMNGVQAKNVIAAPVNTFNIAFSSVRIKGNISGTYTGYDAGEVLFLTSKTINSTNTVAKFGLGQQTGDFDKIFDISSLGGQTLYMALMTHGQTQYKWTCTEVRFQN